MTHYYPHNVKVGDEVCYHVGKIACSKDSDFLLIPLQEGSVHRVASIEVMPEDEYFYERVHFTLVGIEDHSFGCEFFKPVQKSTPDISSLKAILNDPHKQLEGAE